MKAAATALLAGLLVVGAAPAWSHHEVAGYDLAHPVAVQGVVREFVWANPHVMLYLEVATRSSGDAEWALEGDSVQALERKGWTRTSLRPGDRIQVLLAPKRDEQRAGQILRVTSSDGRTLSVYSTAGAS